MKLEQTNHAVSRTNVHYLAVSSIMPDAQIYSHHGRLYLEVEHASATVLEQVREALESAARQLLLAVEGPVLIEAVKPAACFGSLMPIRSGAVPELEWQESARQVLMIALWRAGIRVQRP